MIILGCGERVKFLVTSKHLLQYRGVFPHWNTFLFFTQVKRLSMSVLFREKNLRTTHCLTWGRHFFLIKNHCCFYSFQVVLCDCLTTAAHLWVYQEAWLSKLCFLIWARARVFCSLCHVVRSSQLLLFKKHRRHIHFHLRIASEKLITEHQSLSLRSGDLLCVNCLKAVQKHCSEVAFEPAGPSSLSQECAAPTPFIPQRKIATVLGYLLWRKRFIYLA